MKKIFWGIVIIGFIVIQFFRPGLNVSTKVPEANITAHYATSESVQYILKNACYDCHSNNTEYPWYSKVQPITWFLADHVLKGKKKLNFDEFYTYPLKKQDHKLEELIEVVRDNEMPLKPYPVMHTDARLTEIQKQQLIDWAKGIREQIDLEGKGFTQRGKGSQSRKLDSSGLILKRLHYRIKI